MANTHDLTFDILIVGGGLVGGALAVLLGQAPVLRHLRIGIVESKPYSQGELAEMFDPRVVALTEQSRRMLESAGSWEQIARFACPYTMMDVRDSEGTGSIRFDCADVHQPNLGHIVENYRLQGALYQHIESQPNVDFVYGMVEKIGCHDDHGPILRLTDGSSLTSSLIIAADGANSLIREQLAFALRSWDYGHTAIVGTIQIEKPHAHTACQWFKSSGPLAFLPLQTEDGDCRYASIVWSQNHDEASRLMGLDDSDFCRELSLVSEGVMGRVISISRRFAFPLRQRHVLEYIKPGVALIGDAAHTIHPLAGQGVNLGFADVLALKEEICRGVTRGLDLADNSILERYQRRRKPQNLAMMAAMEGFKRLFADTSPLVRMVRNAGMNQADRILPLKKQLIRQAMGF